MRCVVRNVTSIAGAKRSETWALSSVMKGKPMSRAAAAIRRERGNNGNVASVSIALRGSLVDPVRVTTFVGVAPSRQWFAGEEYSGRNGAVRKHPVGLWALEVIAEGVEASASKLLETLAGREDALRRIADEMQAPLHVAVWWDPEGGQGGFTIPCAVIARLANIGSVFSVYFPG